MKTFIVKNKKLNEKINELKNRHKNLPIKEHSIFDKVNKHFKLYDYAKLELIGDDMTNYGSFVYQGNTYKPKNIKVEYLGEKYIKDSSKIKNKFPKNDYFRIKSKNISFINPLIDKKSRGAVLTQKSFFDLKLPEISQNNINPIGEENKKSNFYIKKEKTEQNLKYINNRKKHLNSSHSRMRNVYNGDLLDYKDKKFSSQNYTKISMGKNNYSKISNSNSNSKNKKFVESKNIREIKKLLKKKIDILENKINISSKFISNGSKINEEEKPQFKIRFNNLKFKINQYIE
jgi:hypothetical protein